MDNNYYFYLILIKYYLSLLLSTLEGLNKVIIFLTKLSKDFTYIVLEILLLIAYLRIILSRLRAKLLLIFNY